MIGRGSAFFVPTGGVPVYLGPAYLAMSMPPQPVSIGITRAVHVHRSLTRSEYRACVKWIRTDFNGLRKSQKATKRRLRFEHNKLSSGTRKADAHPSGSRRTSRRFLQPRPPT